MYVLGLMQLFMLFPSLVIRFPNWGSMVGSIQGVPHKVHSGTFQGTLQWFGASGVLFLTCIGIAGEPI